MPSENVDRYVLREDFRRFMSDREWPPSKNFPARFEDRGFKYNKTYVPDMKKGSSVKIHYIIVLIDFLKLLKVDLLHEYNPDICKTSSTLEIIELIAEPAPLGTKRPALGKNWFLEGIGGAANSFTKLFTSEIVRPQMLCKSEASVKKAADLIYITAGRLIADNEEIDAVHAINLAEEATLLPLHNYYKHAIDAWLFNPWTIAFATVDRERVGCWRVLPLTDEAYDDVYNGRRSIDACTVEDFVMPSGSIYIEAMGERQDFSDISTRTEQLIHCLFIQVAQLSMGRQKISPLRIMTMYVGKTNESYAKPFGFVHTGTSMQDMGFPLMEMDQDKGAIMHLIIKRLQELLAELDE